MENINKGISYAVTLLIFLLVVGVLYFNYAEGWSYVDSFYFCVSTLTTIGFGDLVPTTDVSKIFTSFYALFGIGVMLYVIGSIISAYLFRQEKYFNRVFSMLHLLRKKTNSLENNNKNIEEKE